MKTQYSPKVDRVIYSALTDDFEAGDWFALAAACVDQGEAAMQESGKTITREEK